jgi:hypothetical protein
MLIAASLVLLPGMGWKTPARASAVQSAVTAAPVSRPMPVPVAQPAPGPRRVANSTRDGGLTIDIGTPATEHGTTYTDDMLTVTATVTCDGEGVFGMSVTFEVTGANQHTGSSTSDESGQASYSYAGPNAGPDTITASVSQASPSPSTTTSAPVVGAPVRTVDQSRGSFLADTPCWGDASSSTPFTWTPVSVQISLATLNPQQVGGTAAFTATVHDADPYDVSTLNYTIDQQNADGSGCPDGGRTFVGQGGSNGGAGSFANNGQSGTDTVHATLIDGQGLPHESNSVQASWTPSLSVEPGSFPADSYAGDSLQPTANVTDLLDSSGATVTMTATTTGQTTITETATPVDGVATFAPYTRQAGGVDSIQLVATDGDATASATVTHTWHTLALALIVPAPPHIKTQITLSPTVLVDGLPVSGANVTLTAHNGIETDYVCSGVTPLLCAYTRNSKGPDNIAVSATYDDHTLSDTAVMMWLPGRGIPIAVTPPNTTSGTNTPFTVTATVSDTTVPVGTPVFFTVTGPAGPTLNEVRPLLAGGVASLTYTRSVPGTDLIEASINANGTSGEASTNHFWKRTAVALSLGPAGTRTLVGDTFQATASLTRDGNPIPHATVTFLATRPGIANVPGSAITNDAGLASFTYSRTSAGVDTISATAVQPDGTVEQSMAHIWQPPNGLWVVATPSGTSDNVNQQFHAFARVLDGVTPVAGAVVNFRVSMYGVPDLTGTGNTDADGVATWTYSRAQVGMDVVTADVDVSGRTGQGSLVHYWVPPGGLTLSLSPNGTTNHAGDVFTISGRVTNDEGVPVPGAHVSIDATMTGQDDYRRSATSDSAGSVIFKYSRGSVGLDVVQGRAVADTRSGVASLVHFWDPETIGNTLALDPPATLPGGDALATGSGCGPHQAVTLSIGRLAVGRTTSDERGRFSTSVSTPQLPLGRYAVSAACGAVISNAPIDLVQLTASTGTSQAGVTTTAAVLAFFVLLGSQLSRWTRQD